MATTKVFTTDAAEDIVDWMDTQDWFMGIGTGGTTAAVGDAALIAEVETRDETTDSQPSAVQFQAVGSITLGTDRALDEAGLFTAATDGRLWVSAAFDVVNLDAGDTFQGTFQITFQDSSV